METSSSRPFWLAAASGLAASVADRVFAPKLRDQVVIVTGGSRGLGLLIAEEFARLDCRIVLCARDEKELEEARMRVARLGARVLACQGDVGKREDMDRVADYALSRFGRVDVLVNNAGIIQGGPVEAMTRSDFEQAMGTMFYGPLNAIEAVLPSMKRRQSGRIVNITSVGGLVAVPHLLPYTCAKFAAQGLSEGLFAELARYGISVTTVAPGLLRTGSTQNALFKGKQELEKAWFALAATLPLTAMSAERAARRIVLAARRREPFVTLSWQAKLLRLAHDLFPTPTLFAMSAAARVLPSAAGPTDSVKGMDVRAPGPLEAMVERDALQTNEYAARSATPKGTGAPPPVIPEQPRGH
ncbi:MAG: SDR family NAD(P)-dependent oxidoreductase [Myxococcales bacterium]